MILDMSKILKNTKVDFADEEEIFLNFSNAFGEIF